MLYVKQSMDLVQSIFKNWKWWLPCVWFWGNILYHAVVTWWTLASVHRGQVGPKRMNSILKRWVTIASLLLLRELLEPVMSQLHHAWILLSWLGTLCFLENYKPMNASIFEYVVAPFLSHRQHDIDLLLHRLSFYYLEWKTFFLQLVAYCSSELLRRTAHYLVADTELSRKLSSLDASGGHHLSPSRGTYEQHAEKKRFLPSSYIEENNLAFSSSNSQEDFADTNDDIPSDSCVQPSGRFLANSHKPYERIHELRMLLKQQKSRRNSSVSQKKDVI